MTSPAMRAGSVILDRGTVYDYECSVVQCIGTVMRPQVGIRGIAGAGISTKIKNLDKGNFLVRQYDFMIFNLTQKHILKRKCVFLRPGGKVATVITNADLLMHPTK